MTPLMQSAGLGQMLGNATGAGDALKRPSSGDFTQQLGDTEDQLAALAEMLGIPLQGMSQEMLAMLQQWLQGGGGLPQAANADLSGDQALPPFAQLAQLLGQSAAGDADTLEGLELPLLAQAKDAAALNKGGQGAFAELGKVLGDAAPLPASLLDADKLQALGQGLSGSFNPVQANNASFSQVLTSNLLSMGIPQKVGDSGWGQAMAERLVWMVKGDQQMAELKITPPNLGPLEVKLTINNDQASVAFLSNHAAVRDAIEAAIPRLREMLGQESLNLVNVDVGHGRNEQSGQGEGSGSTAGPGGGDDGDGELGAAGEQLGLVDARGLGLIDLFA